MKIKLILLSLFFLCSSFFSAQAQITSGYFLMGEIDYETGETVTQESFDIVTTIEINHEDGFIYVSNEIFDFSLVVNYIDDTSGEYGYYTFDCTDNEDGSVTVFANYQLGIIEVNFLGNESITQLIFYYDVE